MIGRVSAEFRGVGFKFLFFLLSGSGIMGFEGGRDGVIGGEAGADEGLDIFLLEDVVGEFVLFGAEVEILFFVILEAEAIVVDQVRQLLA